MSVSAQARYFVFLAILFGGVVWWAWGGLLGPRVTASASTEAPRRLALAPLTEAEQRNYDFRLRQLGQDLKRDSTDFEVLRRLGQLHLRLAVCQIQSRGTHLRRARYYLRRAADVALTNREGQMVRGLLDAANSPNPSIDWVMFSFDYGPPPRMEEEVVRWRLGWLEEQVGLHPESSRLLTRLGETYTMLFQILAQGGQPHAARWPGASAVSDSGEAARLAEHNFRRALKCGTTHEAQSRAWYGLAELYRAAQEPARASEALHEVLSLQPNNWFAALEMARVYRQLSHPDAAAHCETEAARWRTPGWI
jgi:tetratricopeptide (TPR) repeat protein